jgi:hypothetical protein
MTVITEAIENIAGLEDNAVVWFYVEDLRPRAEGSGIVTPTRVPVKPVAGVLTTPPLNPGPAKVMYGLSSYDIVIPDSVSPVALWPLIRDYIPQTPPVVDAAVAAKNDAESARDEAQQILDDVAAGVVPDAGVAARVAASGSATRSAVDARVTAVGNATYAPAFATTGITYDGSGNVQTVTENGVTTTYTYNGDGSVHTDTRLGVTRTYTYDGSGNLTGIAS